MAIANTGLVLGQAFQTAYVTTDMDRAVAVFDQRFGVKTFLRSGRRTIPLETGGQMTMDIALAWVGDSMIEIIQPLADNVAVYADWLPKEGFGLRFHHIGIRLNSSQEWEQMLQEIGKHDHKICFHLTASNTKALYIDTAALLGHYVEYLFYMDPSNSSLPRIPQNIAGHPTKY